jgi:hypothetical protein
LKEVRASRLAYLPRMLSRLKVFNDAGTLSVGITIANVHKDTTIYVAPGQSILEPDVGPEGDRLVALALAVRKLALEAPRQGEVVTDLKDGLTRIVAKELAPEHLHLGIHHGRELPPRAGDRPPGPTEDKAPHPMEGWFVTIQGPYLFSQRLPDPANPQDPTRHLQLSAAELRGLAKLLLDEGALDMPARLMKNDRHGKGLRTWTFLHASAFGKRVDFTTGREKILPPEDRRRFGRIYERLHQLHLRALREGRPRQWY